MEALGFIYNCFEFIYTDVARSWINVGKCWKDVEIISMGMAEFDRACQIVRLCGTFCVLVTEIVHNA